VEKRRRGFRGEKKLVLLFFIFLGCGNQEFMLCYIRDFRGGRHNQGWRGGSTSTNRDGVLWGG